MNARRTTPQFLRCMVSSGQLDLRVIQQSQLRSHFPATWCRSEKDIFRIALTRRVRPSDSGSSQPAATNNATYTDPSSPPKHTQASTSTALPSTSTVLERKHNNTQFAHNVRLPKLPPTPATGHPSPKLRPRPQHSLYALERPECRNRLRFSHRSRPLRKYGTGFPTWRLAVPLEPRLGY